MFQFCVNGVWVMAGGRLGNTRNVRKHLRQVWLDGVGGFKVIANRASQKLAHNQKLTCKVG
jgi:hypothetical protein